MYTRSRPPAERHSVSNKALLSKINLSNTKAWFICFDYFVGDGIYSSLGFRLAGAEDLRSSGNASRAVARPKISS